MDAERYGRGRVPRGWSLTSGCRAVWERACTEGVESNQWMQSGMGEGVYRGGGV